MRSLTSQGIGKTLSAYFAWCSAMKRSVSRNKMDIKKLKSQSVAFRQRAILCGLTPGMEFYANILSQEAKRIDDEIAAWHKRLNLDRR